MLRTSSLLLRKCVYPNLYRRKPDVPSLLRNRRAIVPGACFGSRRNQPGLFTLLWALLSGRFLASRGAVFPALAALRIKDKAVRRAEAALAYGRFCTQDLVSAWHTTVRQEGQWRAHCHEGIRPVPCDLVGFYRPRLRDCTTKQYTAQAGKALPALVSGLCVAVGSLGRMRLGTPRLLLRPQPDETEADLQSRLVQTAGAGLAQDEARVLDAGFPLADVRAQKNVRFVVRMAVNTTARRNVLPAYAGRGA